MRLLVDDELVDAIDELVTVRGAVDDLAIRAQADVDAQELIDEALNRGITYPLTADGNDTTP